MNAKINTLRSYQESNRHLCTKGNLYSVPPMALEEEAGFNPRDYESLDVQAHIRGLADAYKAGRFVPPIVVKVVEGRVIVRDGHCRRLGLHLAISEGADIQRTPVHEHRGDEIEDAFLILSTNQGLEITALERADVYRRLKGWNLTNEEISARVGKSAQHVGQYLQLLELPVALKQAIRDGKIAPSAALQVYQEQGPTKAAETISSAIEKAAGKGKGRVTAKSMQSGPRITKRAAQSMYSHFSTLTDRLRTAVSTADQSEAEQLISISITAEEAQAILALREKIDGEQSVVPSTGEKPAE